MPYLEVNETRLHYRERGSGQLALFVHGYPLDGSMWLDQLEALASRRRCVAVDLRGCGLSEATTLPALTMEQHADDVAAVIAAFGEDRADIVALSMGGYVALALCERHPEVVRSVALVDTKATADDEAGKEGRRKAAAQVVVGGRAELADGMLAALLAEGASPFVRGRVRSMIEGTRYETIVACLEGMRQRPDRTEVLSRIEVATALIVGEHDKVTPPGDSEAMRHVLPNATLHVIPGAGHLSPIEQPRAVNDALESLFDRVQV